MENELLNQQGFLLFIIIAIAIITLFITRRLLKISFPYVFTGLIGLTIGLWVGSLVAAAAKNLPGLFGQWLPIISEVFVTVSIMDLFIAQAKSVSDFFQLISKRIIHWAKREERRHEKGILIDTSALIDGRLENIIKSGFVNDSIIIPRFVLKELQLIADSSEPLKRAKGKRGIEILTKINQLDNMPVLLTKDELGRRQTVDDKLVQMAHDHGYRILTVDYNLNQIASIAGIKVLNINELTQALRPNLVPGEDITVKVVQKGKEKGQGIGYLPDGTMIVVEEGAVFLGEDVVCTVERIFQTVSGKMIFVKLKK